MFCNNIVISLQSFPTIQNQSRDTTLHPTELAHSSFQTLNIKKEQNLFHQRRFSAVKPNYKIGSASMQKKNRIFSWARSSTKGQRGSEIILSSWQPRLLMLVMKMKSKTRVIKKKNCAYNEAWTDLISVLSQNFTKPCWLHKQKEPSMPNGSQRKR